MLNKLCILLAILTIPAVYIASTITSKQSPVAVMQVGMITLNFVFMLGLWGYFTQKFAEKKKWGKRKSMIFYVTSTLILFVVLRVAGAKTIFG